VVEIDRRMIGSGRPGPATQKLMQIFHHFAAQPESGEEIR
jgi:hypothetical protein